MRSRAIVGGVLLTTLKYFGGLLIGRATANPLLGAVAVAVGRPFWLNLKSRLVLLCSAWAANDIDIARLAGVEEAPEDQFLCRTLTPFSRMPNASSPRPRRVVRVIARHWP